MTFRNRSAQEIVNSIPWWAAALSIALVTFFFAVGYWKLSASQDNSLTDNLTSPPAAGVPRSAATPAHKDVRISFPACIYFSVVTESTLGDGTIVAQGTARLMVAFQVMVGLFIAGIVVAKVLATPNAAATTIEFSGESDTVTRAARHTAQSRQHAYR